MKTTLYLGTDPTQFESQGRSTGHLIHYPVIKILPRGIDHPEIRQAFDDLSDYTHLIFTSKNAVSIFFDHLALLNRSVEELKTKNTIAIGQVTASYLSVRGLQPSQIAEEETQEGVIRVLNPLDLSSAYVFLPRSSLSRPVLANFFHERQIRYQACDLYDTTSQKLEPVPNLNHVDEIVFTSPSTVTAFMEIFGALPKGMKCVAIGPVTTQALQKISISTN